MLSLGLGLTVLVATALIEGNLREQLTRRIPSDAPAFFFVDIVVVASAISILSIGIYGMVTTILRVCSLLGSVA